MGMTAAWVIGRGGSAGRRGRDAARSARRGARAGGFAEAATSRSMQPAGRAKRGGRGCPPVGAVRAATATVVGRRWREVCARDPRSAWPMGVVPQCGRADPERSPLAPACVVRGRDLRRSYSRSYRGCGWVFAQLSCRRLDFGGSARAGFITIGHGLMRLGWDAGARGDRGRRGDRLVRRALRLNRAGCGESLRIGEKGPAPPIVLSVSLTSLYREAT